MASTTSTAIVNVLRDIFSRFGLPKTLVSDNGPQFVADEFKAFLQQNGVKHVTSSPYHSRTNGLAERFVRSFKTAMKKCNKVTNKEINLFLITYRITSHATTGETPAILLIGRNLRTRLDLLKPDTSSRVRRKQDNMKLSRHTGSKVRMFTMGQSVMVRDYRKKIPWIHATVMSSLGPLTYQVKTDKGGVWRHHVDQMRKSSENYTESTATVTVPTERYYPPPTSNITPPETPAIPYRAKPSTDHRICSTDPSTPSQPQVVQKPVVVPSPTAERRYPVRDKKPMKRLIAE